MILIDQLKSLTMANGVVRMEFVTVGADGNPTADPVVLAVPANQYGPLLTSLSQAGQSLQEKLKTTEQQ